MTPTKRITDHSFRYVRSEKTDIAATFRRIRRELEANKAEQHAKVAPIKREAKR